MASLLPPAGAGGAPPEGGARAGVEGESTEAGAEFYVNLTDLSFRHDIRPLVLRTALTFLELLGACSMGTPSCAAYELKPRWPPRRLPPIRGRTLALLFIRRPHRYRWLRLQEDPGALTTELCDPGRGPGGGAGVVPGAGGAPVIARGSTVLDWSNPFTVRLARP